MKYIYLFIGLISLGLCVVCVTHSAYHSLPGLTVATVLFFHWLHAAELADHFNQPRPKQPLAGLALAGLLAALGLVWSASK